MNTVLPSGHGQDSALAQIQPPAAALWLAGFGVLPFAGCAAASLFLEDGRADQAAYALSFYGAVILSFLGGIRWGLAILHGRLDGNTGLQARELMISIVPPLIAWGALLLPREGGLMVLAAGLLLMLAADLLATKEGLAPAWYPKLRWPPTLIAAASLLTVAFA